MKNIKNILVLVAMTFVGFGAQAQCAEDDVIDGCGNKLKSGFTYLKTYDVDEEGEYSYVFSKGNTYLVQTCEEGSINKNMKITIMDRTKHKIAANYGKGGDLTANLLAYVCKSTSIYYIKFEIDEDSDKECGVGILGFK